MKEPVEQPVLARCDAIDLGRHLPPGAAQIAYLDPPFGAGILFGARQPRGGSRAHGPIAYDDRWRSMDSYLAWLGPRIAVVRERLAGDGTMWLHLDHRAVHDAKVLCDRIFGRDAFLGEVIWATGNGARGMRRGPPTTHQTLLIYARSGGGVWNARDPALREPFATTSLAMHFTKSDERGRRYRERTIAGRSYRYYADEGRALGSIWSDCPAMIANTPLCREATGYPTQKPIKLLERIVRASSVEGSLVLDPFCGSGTSLLAAGTLRRTFFGCDTGALAIETAARRLRTADIPFELRLDSAECQTPHTSRSIPSS